MAFNWTNRDAILNVSRAKSLVLNWNGGAPEASTIIVGYSVDMPTNSGAIFACLAPPGSVTFSVPADVLANLPAARARAIQSRAILFVEQWNMTSQQAFVVAGLDVAELLSVLANGKTVSFQ